MQSEGKKKYQSGCDDVCSASWRSRTPCRKRRMREAFLRCAFSCAASAAMGCEREVEADWKNEWVGEWVRTVSWGQGGSAAHRSKRFSHTLHGSQLRSRRVPVPASALRLDSVRAESAYRHIRHHRHELSSFTGGFTYYNRKRKQHAVVRYKPF